MSTYVVTRKADGAEVYRYEADAPIEWAGFEFATHEHVELATPPETPAPAAPRRVTKLAFIERLGDAAFEGILQLAKTDVSVEAFVERFRAVTPDPDGTSMDLADPRTVAGVTAIGQALEQMGVVPAGWAEGVLNV